MPLASCQGSLEESSKPVPATSALGGGHLSEGQCTVGEVRAARRTQCAFV